MVILLKLINTNFALKYCTTTDLSASLQVSLLSQIVKKLITFQKTDFSIVL